MCMNFILFFKLRPVDDLFPFDKGCWLGSQSLPWELSTVSTGERGDGGVFDRVVSGE